MKLHHIIVLIALALSLYASDKIVKKREASYNYQHYLKNFKGIKREQNFEYRYKFGGEVSYDAGYVDSADAKYSDRDFRRIRLYHKGSFNKKLLYELEYNYNKKRDAHHYKDIYIGYKGRVDFLDATYRVKIGNIKIPFSLERYSSSKYVTFMERSLGDIFSVSRELGSEFLVSKKIKKERINFFTSLFSASIDDRVEREALYSGAASRLTYAYKFHKRDILSLGVAVMYKDTKGDRLKLKQESESKLIKEKYISVKIEDVDYTLKGSAELLYIYNKFALLSEYKYARIRSQDAEYNFDAFYVAGSYFLVGSGKQYNAKVATLAKIKPKRGGALEFALRYSYVNLNSKDEHGGVQRDYTYGINYYLSKEIKVMLNHVIAHPKETDDYSGRLHIIQARVLFAF